jgi:hypothetical protein
MAGLTLCSLIIYFVRKIEDQLLCTLQVPPPTPAIEVLWHEIIWVKAVQD